MKLLRVALLAFACSLAAAAMAIKSPIGVWKGHMEGNFTQSSTPQNDPNKQMRQSMARQTIANFKIKLTIKKGGTYVMVVTGLPGGRTEKHGGHWTLKKNKITLKSDKKEQRPEVGVLSKDGKKITIDESRRGFNAVVIFIR